MENNKNSAQVKNTFQSFTPSRRQNPRSPKRVTTRVKLVHTTLWLHPDSRAELERIAKREGLSLSSIGAEVVDEWVRHNIHKQYSTLIQPILRQIIREEIQVSDNRKVFFLMRIAYTTEQARIIIINLAKLLITTLLRLPLEKFEKLIDDSDKMARRKITEKSPQMKALLDEWKGSSLPENKKTEGSSN